MQQEVVPPLEACAKDGPQDMKPSSIGLSDFLKVARVSQIPFAQSLSPSDSCSSSAATRERSLILPVRALASVG
jgi:hypothetical protein